MADQASQSVKVDAQAEGPVTHLLDVEVDAKRVGQAFDRAYKDLAKQVNVKGFRPGKTPRPVLERLYGASVAEQLEQSLVAETLLEAIESVGLEPVAEPGIEADPPTPGEAFRYRARIEVKPPIELPDLAGLPAKRPKLETTDEDVARELETLRQRQMQLLEEPDGTALAEGHVASIDFVGRVDGEPFEGGSGRGVDLEVGAGRFIPGFEEQLVGAAAGDDREVSVTFPDDYAAEELAGKAAVFSVHVASVRRQHLPELDDDFAKDLDLDSLEELRTRIREDLEAGQERAAREMLHRTVVDSLIERAPFDVPNGMVERELARRLRSAHQRLEGQLPHDALHQQLDRWKQEWREEAERSVREELLLGAIAEAESIEVPGEDVAARVEELAESQGVSAARLRKGWEDDALERAVATQLRDERALEFLVSRAKVEETTDT